MSLRKQPKTLTSFMVYFECDRTWYLVSKSKVRYDGVPRVGEKYSVQWGNVYQLSTWLVVGAGDYSDLRKLYLSRRSTVLETTKSATKRPAKQQTTAPKRPAKQQQRSNIRIKMQVFIFYPPLYKYIYVYGQSGYESFALEKIIQENASQITCWEAL